jgi:hypothetical protein
MAASVAALPAMREFALHATELLVSHGAAVRERWGLMEDLACMRFCPPLAGIIWETDDSFGCLGQG